MMCFINYIENQFLLYCFGVSNQNETIKRFRLYLENRTSETLNE